MSDKGATSSAKDHESPFTKPWFLVSAGVIVVIVVLAVVYFLLPPTGQPAAVQPTQPESSSLPSSSTDDGASVCGLAAGDQRLPGLELTSKWELNGKTAVPTSLTDGPGKRSEDGARTCYAQNPTGALYAAANFFSASIEKQGQIMVEDLSAEGPSRDKYLQNPMTFAPGVSDVTIQLAGFKIQSYAKDAATVVLGIKTSDAMNFSLTVPLKWESGDWKVNLDNLSRMAQVSNLSDFIPWAGV
ncbi:hypothetical protein ACX80E_15320 [Arthrobacter sp. TMN-49]